MTRTVAVALWFVFVAAATAWAGGPPPATDCDRLAASSVDPSRPQGVAGVTGDAIDWEKAVPACRAALQTYPKDPRLSTALARALERSGNGSEQEIADLYREADAAGNLAATSYLAALYEEGRGVEADPAKARELYLKAAQGGIGSAMNSLGVLARDGALGEKNANDAAQWFRKAAAAGDTDGQYNYGVALKDGEGVARDHVAAAEQFTKAVAQGHVGAKTRLGEMLDEGAGMPKDHQAALKLFEEAANAGDARAINNLATIYAEGRGVPVDVARAVTLYERAGGLGESVAYFNLAKLYDEGKRTPADNGKAAEYLVKALTNGSADALREVRLQLKGWQSQTIGALQQILQDENLFNGPLDGSFSPELEDALTQMTGED